MSQDQPSVSRIPLPPVGSMTESQRTIYDQTLRFFGAPIGPRIVFLDTPEIGLAWSNLLTQLEKTAIAKNLWELSILIVARDWDSQFEWWAHEGPALKAGLSQDVVNAIRIGDRPVFAREDEAATYAYVTELLTTRRVSDATYQRLKNVIGSRQMIELTVLVGHYANVAMTLAAHDVPLPPKVAPPLPDHRP